MSWLRRQETYLQLTVDADVDSLEQDGVLLVAAECVEVAPAHDPVRHGQPGQGGAVSGSVSAAASDAKVTESGLGGPMASAPSSRLTLAPLERLAVPQALSGADGENRSRAFCYIQARNDLEAVRAYLNRYRDQPKTLRAYTKELERFLLWAVVLRGKPMSSLLVDDCEAYKDFLKKPDPRFVGERFVRHSPRWRPFAPSRSTATADGSAVLLPESQRYAVRLLRSAFAWLVDVRYLAGNPWVAVNDPPIVRRANSMKIDRALPAELWRKLRDELDVRCADPLASQWRALRATVLLMGDSGLRREEAASARREDLKPSVYGTLDCPVWELTIVGKGRRERTVPVSLATLSALRAHWQDRSRTFDFASDTGREALVSTGPLLAPIIIPWTDASRRRHRKARADNADEADSTVMSEAGYTADGLNRLIGRMTNTLVETMDSLDLEERMRLGQVNAHAFRHTFGTQSVADDVPVDVVQKVLGHVSLQTTTIYVQAEKQRVLEEVARYYAGVAARKTAT